MNDLYLRFLRIVQTLDGRKNTIQDIEQTFEGKNRHNKFLVPTKAANTYFDRMSGAMQSAVNT